MRLLLVTPRGGAGAADAQLAAALRGLGHDVQQLAAAARAPAFHRVQAQVIDHRLEVRLAQRLRDGAVDVVHVLGYAGGSSCSPPWIARGLGVPVVVDAVAEHVLCHRRTLVDHRNESCRSFEDPARCRACCDVAPRGLRRLLPFASRVQFQNRLEVALGHLQHADLVLVQDAESQELLAAAGLPRRLLRLLPQDQRTAPALAGLYAELTARSGS